MNMVFDTANEAKDFFVEWSDGENFMVRLGRSRLERGLSTFFSFLLLWTIVRVLQLDHGD